MKKPNTLASPNPVSKPQPVSPQADGAAMVRRVGELLDADQPGDALLMIEQSGRTSPAARNARGVCLMRLGRYADAAKVYEDLLFAGPSPVIADDTPIVFRVNYAATLLMLNDPTLAQSHLYHVRHAHHPATAQLTDALASWKRTLPAWRRLVMLFAGHPPFTPPAGFKPGWL